jgi:hypothetical protein
LAAMEVGSPPTQSPKRIAVGDVIEEAFSVYRQNVAALLGSAIVVFLVVGLVSRLLFNTGSVILGLLGAAVSLAGGALYTGFVVKLVQDVRDGRRDHTVGDLLSAASPFILPLIGFGILYGIGVAIGLILIIVPGLILITFWSVGAPAIVVEGIGPIDAFGRSWQLVRGNAWNVFGALVVALLIVIGVGVVFSIIATPIGNGEVSTWIASIVSNTLTAPIFAIVATVIYYDLAGGAPVSAQATAKAAPPPPPPSEPPPPPPPPATG